MADIMSNVGCGRDETFTTEYPKIYPDLSNFIETLSTSTLKMQSRKSPEPTCRNPIFKTPLEPSAPPEDIISFRENSSVTCRYPAPKDRSKNDLHNWSQWRCQLNQQLSDYVLGSRPDIRIENSFDSTFSGKRIRAIYNHALTKDSPSTCLATTPYLLYGIPRVKRVTYVK